MAVSGFRAMPPNTTLLDAVFTKDQGQAGILPIDRL